MKATECGGYQPFHASQTLSSLINYTHSFLFVVAFSGCACLAQKRRKWCRRKTQAMQCAVRRSWRTCALMLCYNMYIQNVHSNKRVLWFFVFVFVISEAPPFARVATLLPKILRMREISLTFVERPVKYCKKQHQIGMHIIYI